MAMEPAASFWAVVREAASLEPLAVHTGDCQAGCSSGSQNDPRSLSGGKATGGSAVETEQRAPFRELAVATGSSIARMSAVAALAGDQGRAAMLPRSGPST